MKSMLLGLAILVFAGTSFSQTSTFTYQGKLTDMGSPASGTYEMQFALYEVPTGGAPIAPVITNSSVQVVGGIFTVNLSFGSNVFLPNVDRWIELSVKRPADPGFTMLSPRQPITSAPYSIKSIKAESSVDSDNLGGIPANQYVVTTDPRMSDDRDPLPGSGHYIQNTATAQTMSNFNISGNGTIGGTLSGNTVNTQTQYDLAGQRVLGVSFEHNTFGGIGAGAANPTGIWNTFFGHSAGGSTTTGDANSFFGRHAGTANVSGGSNSFFGQRAGVQNISGHNNSYFGYAAGTVSTTNSDNSFFGAFAGVFNTATGNAFFGYTSGHANTTGSANAFFGRQSGLRNTTGSNNSFFGVAAGIDNVEGGLNTFIGRAAGLLNTSGNSNTFVGMNAGNANLTGSNNTVVGADADVSASGLSFATAIGAGAVVSSSNTLLLGRNLDTVNIPGSQTVGGSINAGTEYRIGGLRMISSPGTNTFVGISAGSAAPAGTSNTFVGQLAGANITSGGSNVFVGTLAGTENTAGFRNSFFGKDAGSNNSDGDDNSFFGIGSGSGNTTGNANTFVGGGAGNANITGSNNTALGANANIATSNFTFATAIGAGALATESNSVTLGRAIDAVNVPGDFLVLGFGFMSEAQIGRLIINTSAAEPGTVPVCLNSVSNRVNVCTSSIRYKDNVSTFRPGLDLLNRLRPVSFSWKSGGDRDLGLVAEEVAAVEPRLAIYNKDGEVQGVKYDRIGVILINAVKEQQEKIDEQQQRLDDQQRQIESQRKSIEALKALICSSNRRADVCR